MSESALVGREPCPKCGSRDNLARYDDGHGYCFGCTHYEPGDGPAENRRETSVTDSTSFVTGRFAALPARKITEETCRKFGYTVGEVNGKPAQIADYRDDTGKLVGQKIRYPDKSFVVRGSISGVLFGSHLWRRGGRRIIITEGEVDALSVSQVLDHKWPAVSIPNGAPSAKKALSANLEYLNKFEAVVLCFDMDKAGREAVESCLRLFPPGKLKIASLPLKDANEMLVAGLTAELATCLWEAKEYRPDGIVSAREVREEAIRPPTRDLSWCLPDLDEKMHGRRYGECAALGAGTGVGKTTLLTQQIAHDLRVEKVPVAVFAFEQTPGETVKRVAGQMVGKTFHVPGSGWTQDELEAAVDDPALAGLYLYNHFGACAWGNVRESIRYLRHAHGVRVFYLDHLTALAESGNDERGSLEEITKEIGGLVKELDCWLLFVSHLSTPEGKSHEEGGRVMIKHFKGSRAIGFWSHVMIGMERDQQSDEPSERGTTVLRVLKERMTGQATGFTTRLSYDPATGLLSPAPPEISGFGPVPSGDNSDGRPF